MLHYYTDIEQTYRDNHGIALPENIPPGDYLIIIDRYAEDFVMELDLINDQSGYECFEPSYGGN